jgi:hypothetical protein
MTWYANEIVLPATDQAMEWVRREPTVRAFAYCVRSIESHPWYDPRAKHGLPVDGLLFVRPVHGRNCAAGEWHDDASLDWAKLSPSTPTFPSDETVSRQLADYLGEDETPPEQFRSFLSGLSRELSCPVLYYACAMWGGDIEFEYTLLYSPQEVLQLTATTPNAPPGGVQDSLVPALARLGLNLPTAYFAPHTRGFPWEEYAVAGAT